VFGQAVGHYQNTRYTLAELQTEVQVARVFVDKCSELLLQDKLDTATASMAKYWCSDLQCKVMDECVQLHGGYGYMWEYPITRAYADATLKADKEVVHACREHQQQQPQSGPAPLAVNAVRRLPDR
jgi:acyl-CoA dehydrogenase